MQRESDAQMYLTKARRRLSALRDKMYHPRVPIDDIEMRITPDREAAPAASAAKGYKAVALGEEWGDRWITGWFRFRFEVPEQMAGRPLAALIETGGESLSFIDCEPFQGLDPNRNDLRLADSPAGGESFEVLVESVCMNAFGAYSQKPRLTRAEIATVNRTAEQFYYDVSLLVDLCSNLPEDSRRRGEIIRALDRALEAFDWRTDDPAVIESTAEEARSLLEPVLKTPAAPSAGTVFATGHAHIDVAWLWPLWETRRKVGRTFSTALHYMDRYPDYSFTVSQPQLYEFCRDRFPTLYARIKAAIERGQWDPAGAMWVEADCNIPSGESLVRQLVHGRRFLKEELASDTDTLWLPDVFGYSAALPGILQHCGISYFLTTKIDWNQINTFPHDTFTWRGIDGSEVLAHFPPAQTYNGDMSAAQVLKTEREFAQKDRSPGAVYSYGFGDGGGGPTVEMIERARRMADLEGAPRVEMVGVDDFFRRVEKESSDLPLWVGELYLELHRGTYTTQARTKRDNRRSEEALFEAEMLSVAALALGGTYPTEELDEAWKLLLLNQFHDVIPGSSIKEVYEDNLKHFEEIRTATGGVRTASLDHLVAQIDTSGPSQALVVTNSLSHERGGLLRLGDDARPADRHLHDETGRPIRWQQVDGGILVDVPTVPPCGWRALSFIEKQAHPDPGPEIAASTDKLTNGIIEVDFDDRGEIASIVDLRNGRSVIADGEAANVFELFDDRPNNWDAWDIDRWYYDNPPAASELVSSELVESGPLRATIRQTRTVGNSTITQDISLSIDSAAVEFRTRVDWKEDQRMLKVAFPVEIVSPEATFEVQFGCVRRPTHRNTPWDKARFEVVAQRWIDLSEPGYGVALMNDCKYGHDVLGNRMRITLLRAPASPDPTADRGSHEFAYSLMPHRGDHREAGVLQAAEELNVPLRAIVAEPSEGALGRSGSVARVTGSEDIVISAIKKADNEDLIAVRLYEAHGSRGAARLEMMAPVRRAWLSDGMEQKVEEIEVTSGGVDFDYTPFAIRTFLVELV